MSGFRCLTFFALLCVTEAAVSADKADLKITLPAEFPAVAGQETAIYFDNIVLSEHSDRLVFDVRSTLGNSERERWVVVPTENDVGRHDVSISVHNAEGIELATASTVINVVSSKAGAQRKDAIRLLIIGDSLTHASLYPNHVAALLSRAGNPAWEMLGTHKPSSADEGVAHEGYGGWRWESFVSRYEPDPDGTYRKRSSPLIFMNEDNQPELNVDRYFTEHCGGKKPDYIVIMLGINDCFSAPANDPAGIDARIDTVFGFADQLLHQLRMSAPQAAIGVCLTTPPNSRQAAFEANYQDRYTRWGWKQIQHQLVRRQIQWLNAKGDSQITAVATELNLDPVAGYPDNNAVHPNAVGYQQIGTSIYSWLKWQLAEQDQLAHTASQNRDDIFLLPYFLGNGETGVHFAFSTDGLHFRWLNRGHVVLPAPNWGDESLTRDPSIVYHDGMFHMVWTTSWNARSIGYASSTDLVSWTKPVKLDIWGQRTDVKNTWAPELHWDPERKEYLVIWSTTTEEELNDGDGSTDGHGYDHRTWAARTRDFQTWTEPELFFTPEHPEYGVIDPFIAFDDRNTVSPDDDRWVMVIKNEMPPEQGGKNLRLTFSQHMQGPYLTTLSAPVVGSGTDIVNQMGEGPSLFKRNGIWHLYWDAPGSEFSYCLATSPDLQTWTNRSQEMSLPAEQMRHGTVLVVPAAVVKKAMAENRGFETP